VAHGDQVQFSELLVDQSPDAFTTTPPEGTVMYWSKGAETKFGHTNVEAAAAQLDCRIAPAIRGHDVTCGWDRRSTA
jgi:hypothetical protein